MLLPGMINTNSFFRAGTARVAGTGEERETKNSRKSDSEMRRKVGGENSKTGGANEKLAYQTGEGSGRMERAQASLIPRLLNTAL